MRDPRPGEHEDERLSAFLDDELPEDEALDVTRHLSACSACLDELEGLRAARAALRGLPAVPAPPVLLSDVEAAAAMAMPRAQGRIRIGLLALAMAGLVGGAAYVAGGQSEGRQVVPPIDLFVVDHSVRVGNGPMVTTVNLGTTAP